MPLVYAATTPPMPNVIVPFGIASEPIGNVVAGGAAGTLASAALGNTTIFAVPFVVWEPFTVKRLALYNGATVNGNFDIGVYSGDQSTKLVSTGSTAQSGASAYQGVNVTVTTLAPGNYWVAYATSSTTQTIFRWAGGSNWTPISGAMTQTVAAGGGVALPASLTLVTASAAGMPFLQVANDTIF